MAPWRSATLVLEIRQLLSLFFVLKPIEALRLWRAMLPTGMLVSDEGSVRALGDFGPCRGRWGLFEHFWLIIPARKLITAEQHRGHRCRDGNPIS